MHLISAFINESVRLWLDVSPYLLLGMSIAGLLHIFVGKDLVSAHLGKGGFKSIVKATLLGIPLPVCSCGVIPVASSLRKDGANRSAVLSFMTSTPTTGVDSILATYSLMGSLFAIFRPLAALISGMFVGGLDYLVAGKDKEQVNVHHNHKAIRPSFQIKEFLRYSFLEIPGDIGKWLIAGTLLGGAISAFIPADFFSRYIFFPFDFVIALAVGIPLYVCATGSIPIAVSLIAKGFSPGAALVFLIAGPATNTITIYFVRQKLGKKSLYAYLLGISITALSLGFIFNYLWRILGNNKSLITGAGEMLPGWIQALCGVLLFVLTAYSMLRRQACSLEGSNVIEISVPDIDCRHCKMTIESALSKLPGVEKVLVDIDKKTVQVKGTISQAVIIFAIKESGYHPI